jgi:hypothetical protein
MSVRSRSSRRHPPIQRSAMAFARGDRTGVLIIPLASVTRDEVRRHVVAGAKLAGTLPRDEFDAEHLLSAASMKSGVNRWTESVYGDVIDGDTAPGQQLLDVPVGQSVTQIPATATAIASRGNRRLANTDDERRHCTSLPGRRDQPTQHCLASDMLSPRSS